MENPDSNDVGHSCYCNEGYKYKIQKRDPAVAVNDFSALGTDIGNSCSRYNFRILISRFILKMKPLN